MKKSILFFTALCFTCFSTLTAQDNYDDLVAVGDELTIGSPSKGTYQFIHVPKRNFIIKKGGIPKMSSILDNKVIVTKKVYAKNNEIVISFKRTNGRKFFNAYRTLKANLNGAISNGELRLKDSSKTGKIAK